MSWKRLDNRQPSQLRHHRFELDFVENPLFNSMTRSQLNKMLDLAEKGIKKLLEAQQYVLSGKQ